MVGRAACLASTLVMAARAWAQADWRTTAVPFYTTAQYAQASARDGLARATVWRDASGQLLGDLQRHCSRGATVTDAIIQADWRAAAAAWDRLDSVEVGPLVRRRSARAVDFMPTRPAMLERAIKSGPRDAAAMELVGAPAKGFEALEWLLWPVVPQAGSPRCDFAMAVADHLLRESVALADAFASDARTEPEPGQGDAALAEAINQWVGGIERLRWAFMRKPMEMADSREEPAVFPRARSGQGAATWAARWSTLASYSVLGERATPAREGARTLIPFETWLRSRGANELADKLVQSTAQADQAMVAASPQDAASVQAATLALASLTRLAQDQLAPALSVSLGFSDADGD